MFAEDYPRFAEVSDLTPRPERLNERHEAVIGSNRDVFQGARVLDLASHDGRYSFAALKAGAAHVTGVEVRQSLVDKAEETFAFYGQDPATYRFVCSDVFEALAREKYDVDVVLCLGYLYHTFRYTELMFRLHQLAPKYLILDTRIAPATEPTLELVREPSVEHIRGAALDPFSIDRVLVLRPSVPALEMLLPAYGFEIESSYDWERRLAGRPPVHGLIGYAEGQRVTLRCRFRGTDGWDPEPSAVTAGRRSRTHRRPAPASSPAGWRGRVNRTLARVTGYELRRAAH